MSVNLPKEEHVLLGKVETSERVLGDLQQDLQTVEGELGELTQQNQEYDLLSNICRSLEELEKILVVSSGREK